MSNKPDESSLRPRKQTPKQRAAADAHAAVAQLAASVESLRTAIQSGARNLPSEIEPNLNAILRDLRKMGLDGSRAPALVVGRLLDDLEQIRQDLGTHALALPPGSRRNSLNKRFSDLRHKLELDASVIDRVRRPTVVFDPTDPNLVGRMIALALTAQESVPLSSIEEDRFYGAGVYALYYAGDFSAYSPISALPHPIYVGKADPETWLAKTPTDQGDRLHARLQDHIRSITQTPNLKIADFSVRHLVVAGNWQHAAETYLIRLMNPIWNLQANILYGFGKHGDSAKTRRNKRSPWDTLHPGRRFAKKTKSDQVVVSTILSGVAAHFHKHRIFNKPEEIFEEFMREVGSLPRLLSDSLGTELSDDAKAELEGHPGEPS